MCSYSQSHDDQTLTCQHCGHQSKDVHPELVYVGGKGDVWQHVCQNRAACWRRWDAQHGLVLQEVA